MRNNTLPLAVLLLFGFLPDTFSAPSLSVTKLPVRPNPSHTGPTNDPHAVAGQWFRSVATSNVVSRAFEFYDNTANNGGGFMGHLAISGRVVNVQGLLNPPFKITSFDIETTIFNDTPGAGSWAAGTNSHAETLDTATQQTGTLHDVMLTADFAISSQDNLPPYTGNSFPYRDTAPWILAVGHDYEAWYCWTPSAEDELTDGNYYVPTWFFGDIAPGESKTKTLSFSIPEGLDPNDPRGIAILDSRDNGTDILANRSCSLKISNWINDIGLDDGTPYPESSLSSGDVAVFHNLDSYQEEPVINTNYNFKWTQPPDCANGVDIESWGISNNDLPLSVVKVADDWLCDGRPISGLRWWGSYKDWMTDIPSPVAPPFLPIHPTAFLVSWYTDIPVSSSNLFSRPGAVIDSAIYPVSYSVQPQPDGFIKEELWCDSELTFVTNGYFEHEYQYTLKFPAANEWIEKEGSVYWLSVQALYPEPPVTNVWGWKTTDPRSNWNDAAVRIPTPAVTNKMTYPPPGWEAYTNSYVGQSVNMAFELITDVENRRGKKWAQPPDMVAGVNMSSFRIAGGEPSTQQQYRADDWLCDGRRVTDIHWWGSYLGYLTNMPGPVKAPSNTLVKPLGFSIGWYTDIPTNISPLFSKPGSLIADVFVPLTNCHEVYYGTVLQEWPAGTTNYEHEFQYYVDLLGIASPWFETNGVVYWLGVQAVFPPTFEPAQGTLLKGWGWKTTPFTNRWNDASVVSDATNPLWQPGVYPLGHPLVSNRCDLAFELTTDEPGTGTNGWNQPIVIRQLTRQTNATVVAGSVGDGGAGIQILQYNADLRTTNWIDIATNTLPLPAPYTNYWQDTSSIASQRFYRVLQK
jgi:hypothetical protein